MRPCTGQGRALLLASTTALALMSANPLMAQTAKPSAAAEQPVQLDDIIVTAERSEVAIQDAPLAVSAIGAADLQKRQINSIEALASSIPNVSFGRAVGIARIAIRGVGLDTTTPGSEGRVAYHLDGVYLSRPTIALGTFFDVARVEVVRGPQGTLYGRNATGGAVNVITQDPEKDFGGYARVALGNYNLVRAEGAVSAPLSDAVSLRLAVQKVDRDGYGRNIHTGADVDDEHTTAARVKLLIEPNDDFRNVASLDYYTADDANYHYHYLAQGNPTLAPLAFRLGGTTAPNARDTNNDTDTHNRRKVWGFGNQLDWTLGPATLSSVTGYRESKTQFLSDADNTTLLLANLYNREISSQLSQELRLSGKGERFDWLVGAYYFSEDINGVNGFSPMSRALVGGAMTPAIGAAFGGLQKTTSYAAFGQATWRASDKLALIVGLRWSKDRKALDEYSVVNLATDYPGPPPNQFPTPTKLQRNSWSSLTPRVTLEYAFTPDVKAYATYAEGFKGGGYSVGSVASPYQPEKLKDYEAGLKAEWFDRRLRTNLSAFFYDYSNLQVQKVLATGTFFENAAKAEIRGIELESSLLATQNLRIDLNGALLHSEYTQFQTSDPSRSYLGVLNLAGNRIAQAPPYSATLAVQYGLPTGHGDWTFRAESIWVGKVYFNQFNRDVLSQDAHNKLNAFVTWARPAGDWTVTAYGRNLTDETLIATAVTSNPLLTTPVLGTFEPPRTFGLEIGYRF